MASTRRLGGATAGQQACLVPSSVERVNRAVHAALSPRERPSRANFNETPVRERGSRANFSETPPRERRSRANFSETTSWTLSQRIWPTAGQRRAAGPPLLRRDSSSGNVPAVLAAVEVGPCRSRQLACAILDSCRITRRRSWRLESSTLPTRSGSAMARDPPRGRSWPPGSQPPEMPATGFG
jgi:hypothetical protein